MTIKSFKRDMIAKAQKRGCTWENFGQNELAKLKDKYNYDRYANQWSEKKELAIKTSIDELNQWAMHYNLT